MDPRRGLKSCCPEAPSHPGAGALRDANLYYWQSNTIAEVDLVIERGGRLYDVEVKATATPTPGHAEGLARWLALGGPGARGVLACRVEEPHTLRPGIRAVPWNLAW